MRKRRMIIFSVVIGVLAVIMLSIFARIDNWRRDWTTNFASLDPAADDPDLRPLTLAESPTELTERIRKWIDSRPKWALASQDLAEDGSVKIHLTRTTPVLRFTDDIHVVLRPQDQGTTVEAESRSRIGKGDLGQNPRNLKELVQALKRS